VSGDPWAALRALRIGCVKYLNSRPLICAYDGPVIFDHPSALARMLAAGELDAALVPVFGALRDPRYLLVDGAAIACDGPVYSVLLAYKGELRDLRRIALDPASLTSANLLRVLLAEFHGLQPEFGPEGEAKLIIGNQAIEFRLADEAAEGWRVLDLGEEWRRCTGLPFVFALWALRPEIPLAAAEAFRKLKDAGVRQIADLVKTETFATEEIRTRYLTEYLRFEIGDDGRVAIERYRGLLAKYGLIAAADEPLRFV
jgi:chorismate dehydratase